MTDEIKNEMLSTLAYAINQLHHEEYHRVKSCIDTVRDILKAQPTFRTHPEFAFLDIMSGKHKTVFVAIDPVSGDIL